METITAGKKATRDDVARLAGVSTTTVTNVINHKAGSRIGPDTRQRVLDAAKKLNYQAQFTARSLAAGKTGILGLLVPMDGPFTEYYTKMIHGLQQAARDSDYHFLFLAQDQPEKYRRSIQKGYLEGLFVLQSANDEQHVHAAVSSGLPAVSINYLCSLNLPQVSMDYESAMTDAVTGLMEKGRKNISFVCGAWENQPHIRYRGRFHKLQGSLWGKADLTEIPHGQYLLSREERGRIADEVKDALIVDGYETGLQLEQVLKDRGQQPGKDFDMVVFSESQMYQPLDPAVRVLSASPAAVGRAAWEQMLALLKGAAPARNVQKIPFK